MTVCSSGRREALPRSPPRAEHDPEGVAFEYPVADR
jgi:hypothetical protein